MKACMLTIVLAMVIFTAGCSQARAASAYPAAPTAAPPPSSPVLQEPKLDAALDGLMDRIESCGKGLKSFSARMLCREDQRLIGTRKTRNGHIYYRIDSDGGVRVRLHFADLLEENLDLDIPPSERPAPQELKEDFVFDGMWLSRRNERLKTLQRFELASDADTANAFRLGSGQFPLPFSINKSDAMHQFDLALIVPDPNDPPDSEHLELVPKPAGSFAEDGFLRLDLWVSKDRAVPVRFSYEKDDYEQTTFSWTDIHVDEPIADKVFELAPAGTDWTVEVKPLADQPAEPMSEKPAAH